MVNKNMYYVSHIDYFMSITRRKRWKQLVIIYFIISGYASSNTGSISLSAPTKLIGYFSPT